MVTTKLHEIILAGIEFIAFCLNGLTIYIISRLGLKEADMWLGVIMAVLDMLISGFKCFELIEMTFSVSQSIFNNEKVVIPIYAGILFILLNSITCVGYLGLIRWLAICKKYTRRQLRIWWWIFLLNMSLSLILIVSCTINDGFKHNPKAHLAYPDFLSSNKWALATRIYILYTFIFCLTIVNVCYISIGKKYLKQLNTRYFCPTQVVKKVFKKERNLVIFKISIILFFYNITIFPLFVVDLIELIQVRRSSLTEEFIAGFSVACIAFVNPSILITMHCETWYKLRDLFLASNLSKRMSVSQNLPSSIGLSPRKTLN